QVLRNNGDLKSAAGAGAGGFTTVELSGFPELRDVCWGDFDGDGDADLALLDANGGVKIAWDDRAGAFREPGAVSEGQVRAVTFGDLFATGELGLLVREESGAVKSLQVDSVQQRWSAREVANWQGIPSSDAAVNARIHVVDLDNNGALDVVASLGARSAVWLNQGGGKFVPLARVPELFVTA